MRSLTPGQVLVKIVNDELIKLDGRGERAAGFAAQPPAVVLIRWPACRARARRPVSLAPAARARQEEVMVAECDVAPAAIEQLEDTGR